MPTPPYDHAKTQQLLKIAASYASHPMGEYISQLSTQLFDADKALQDVDLAIASARRERDEAVRKATAIVDAQSAVEMKAKLELAALAERADLLLGAVRAIVADARSAKKIATAALEKIEPKPLEAPKEIPAVTSAG